MLTESVYDHRRIKRNQRIPRFECGVSKRCVLPGLTQSDVSRVNEDNQILFLFFYETHGRQWVKSRHWNCKYKCVIKEKASYV